MKEMLLSWVLVSKVRWYNDQGRLASWPEAETGRQAGSKVMKEGDVVHTISQPASCLSLSRIG